MGVLGVGKVQLSFAEEEPEIVDLAGGTIGTTQVTALSGLTASKYAGQFATCVGPGAATRKTWTVQDNATTSITCEEDTLTDDGLANTDDISITQYGKAVAAASCTGWIGIFDKDLKLPDPKKTYRKLRAHGAGRDIAYKAIHKSEYHATIPYVVQDFSLIFFAFGHEYVTGSDVTGGGGSAVNEANDMAIGAKVFDVDASTNYGVDDYIQVGTTTQSEIRKITAISTNEITVDHHFRIAHEDNEVCNEVTSPYTHTLQIKTGHLPSFTMLANYDEATALNRRYFGCKINRLTLRATEEGLLEAEVEIWAADADKVTATKPTVTRATTAPYGYHMTSGGIVVNGTTYARLNSLEFVLNNNLKEKRYHCDRTGTNPYEIIEGGTETELRFNVTVTNLNFWDLLDGETEFEASINVVRAASTDEFTLTFKNCKITDAPHGLPREHGVEVPVVVSMHTDSTTDRSVELQVIDSTPYYGFW